MIKITNLISVNKNQIKDIKNLKMNSRKKHKSKKININNNSSNNKKII